MYGYANHAKVFGKARVIGIVSDEAVISDSATIMESAIVSDKAKVQPPFVVRLLLVEIPTLAIVLLFTVRLWIMPW